MATTPFRTARLATKRPQKLADLLAARNSPLADAKAVLGEVPKNLAGVYRSEERTVSKLTKAFTIQGIQMEDVFTSLKRF